MDEREWLSCDNQHTMLLFLKEKVSGRKLRLYACAVARGDWKWLTRKTIRRCVELGEQFADGETSAELLKAACGAACSLLPDEDDADLSSLRKANIFYSSSSAKWCALDDAWKAAEWAGVPVCSPAKCALLREIVGNPFRPVAFDPALRTPSVLALAQTAYDNRILPAGTLDTDRLAVLADALEEAGCTDADILGHLRGPGPHVRGCWVLDALLDKR